MNLVDLINKILAGLTIAGQVIFLVLLICLIFSRKSKAFQPLVKFVTDRAIIFSLIIALTATLGSLFYSEIAGYEPCKLCWFQRIFMYPQVIILIIALAKKDQRINDYTLVLSIIGGLIAAFHYFSQISGISLLPCVAIGYSVSCARRFVMEFGYLTIPLMSLSAFALIFIFAVYQKIFGRKV